MTVVAALESKHASSSSAQAVIQGKDVSADVREEVNQLTQDLYQSAPAECWESVRYDIEAIEATANAVIVKYVSGSFADSIVTSQMLHTSMQCSKLKFPHSQELAACTCHLTGACVVGQNSMTQAHHLDLEVIMIQLCTLITPHRML